MPDSHAFDLDDPTVTSIGSTTKEMEEIDAMILKAETGTIDVDPAHMMVLRSIQSKERRDIAKQAATAKENKEKRTFWKWVIGTVLTTAVAGGGFTGYRTITAEPEVQPAEVQETVKKNATQIESDVGALQTTVADQGDKIEFLYVGQQDAALQQYEIGKMLSEKLDATSAKAGRVSTEALSTAKKKADAVKKERAEQHSKKSNPFKE